MNKLSKILMAIIVILIIAIIVIVYFYHKRCQDLYLYTIKQTGENIALTEKLEKIENSYNRDIENIDIQIKPDSVTQNGLTIIITDTNAVKYDWNENYKLTKKENGNLVELTPISNVEFNKDNFVFNENNQFEQYIDWTEVYGTLPKGTYILEKDISTYTKTLWCSSDEFEIK